MGRLVEWLVHRERLLGLSNHADLARAAALPGISLDRILDSSSLKGTGRSVRCRLSRALKVSLRDLEDLDAGRRDWIGDERVVDLDRLGSGFVRPVDPGDPVVVAPATAEDGVPVVGRVRDDGAVDWLEDWTPQGGRRLPVRCPTVPDAYALELATAAAPGHGRTAFAVLRGVAIDALRGGDVALLTSVDGRDPASVVGELCHEREELVLVVQQSGAARSRYTFQPGEVTRAARVFAIVDAAAAVTSDDARSPLDR